MRVFSAFRGMVLRIVLLGSCLAASAATTGAGALADASWPASVTGRYRLSFSGLEVGSYNFGSRFDGKSYQAQSDARISALFGAFKWRGEIVGHGTIQKAAAKPATYKMTYKTKSKQASVSLGFKDGRVEKIELIPNKPRSPEAVPLQPEHFVGVYDPMSAILAISHPGPDKPCERRLPVFDGKVRFELAMSLKGEQRLQEKARSGQPTELIVCRVRYIPIAGHRPKDFENPWVDYNGIEIALRPIPSAGIYVPYRITIPTTIGAAEMTAESFDITASDSKQIALRQ